ncbi:MAG: bifunctional hydroxymethylpyrimidine kinase/phosphomethylpyrimidine kinase [Bacteroidota bacterium]
MRILLSYPDSVANEAARINLLMAENFDVFHLRKPNWTAGQVKQLLNQLSSDVLKRTSLHQHHDVAIEFGIQRLHFPADLRNSFSSLQLEEMKWDDAVFSTSVHSTDEYLELSDVFDYTFLGPVFDSISKEGYKAINPDLSRKNAHVDVIALGGITPKNESLAVQMGFDGVAVLGSVWKKYDRPIVLSIAGFDPSGGAGVLADVKTFEQHRCLGFAVQTAITVQTEDQFLSVEWIAYDKIIEQLKPLLAHYSISTIKIGLIESLPVLLKLLLWLKENCPDAKIVWDPILSASAGEKFHSEWSQELLDSILKKVLLLTPNSDEAKLLGQTDKPSTAAENLSLLTNVLLKGGHLAYLQGTDMLIAINGKKWTFSPASNEVYPKHGSGCILSAAIVSNLALGLSLDAACEAAKRYTERALASNKQHLAYHVA